MKDLLPLKEAIYEVGLLFAKATHPTEAQINAYARALSNYSVEQVTFAFNQVVLTGSWSFPSLAEVLKHLRPASESSDDLGNVIANEIIQKCIEKGRYRTDEIANELSPAGQVILERNRYLILEILDSEQDQVPTIRAQIRGLVKGMNETKKAETHNQKLESIGIDTSKVLLLKKPEMKSLDFNDFTQGPS